MCVATTACMPPILHAQAEQSRLDVILHQQTGMPAWHSANQQVVHAAAYLECSLASC